MSNIEYQKIELHSTYDLIKDSKKIMDETEATKRLMTENQIEFTIDIERRECGNILSGTLYILVLIVRKEDIQRVLQLLDSEGGFGYFVDLDKTFNPIEEENQDENPIKEKYEKIEEDEDPIKDFGQEDESDYEKPVVEDLNRTFKFFMNGVLIVSYTIAMVTELIFMSAMKDIGNYEGVTSMFVAIVIETPIALWLFKIINKKKGE